MATSEKTTSEPSTTNITQSLKDCIILITGSTSGLGAATALSLARLNPTRIYISGRRSPAAESITSQIKEISPATDVRFLYCDLADLSSVSAAASRVLDTESRLDILIANAGVAAVPAAVTKDGYEVHFGVNFVGHALLIRKLLPLVIAAPGGGRIVSVTSFAFRLARWGIPFDKVKPGEAQGEWFATTRWLRYAESKLANVVYARELVRICPEVMSVSVCPGFVETEMVAGMRWCDRLGTRMLGCLAGGMVETEEGAKNQIWAATVGREYLVNGGVYDPVGRLCEDPGENVTNPAVGEELWKWTEKEIRSRI